jgi:hypothetical protein
MKSGRKDFFRCVDTRKVKNYLRILKNLVKLLNN